MSLLYMRKLMVKYIIAISAVILLSRELRQTGKMRMAEAGHRR